MFLIMGMVLAIGSTFTEIKLVHGSDTLRRLYTLEKYGVWINTAGSFFLSWIIGLMFAANGLTVLFGAMLSTGMSQAYFSIEGYCHRQGWSWESFKDNCDKTINNTRNAKDAVVSTYRDWKPLITDFFSMVKIAFKIITWPLATANKLAKKYGESRAVS